jgi:hypothetical protein
MEELEAWEQLNAEQDLRPVDRGRGGRYDKILKVYEPEQPPLERSDQAETCEGPLPQHPPEPGVVEQARAPVVGGAESSGLERPPLTGTRSA